MLPFLATTALAQSQFDSRFELTSPLHLPPVYIHHHLAKYGIAQSTANRQNLQARILWIDCTANLGRYNSQEKIAAIVADAKDIGFNTIVFDVKPIGGYPVYPSKLHEQLTSWRDAKLEPGFDPLKFFVQETKKHDITLLVALNAFSEGHSYSKRDFGKPDNQFFKPGWGYDHPELQTVRYLAKPSINNLPIHPSITPASYTEPLAIYNKIPTAKIDSYAIYNPNSGAVVSVHATKPDTLPANHLILAARDPQATPTILSLLPGQKLKFQSQATFVPIGEDQNQIPLMMNPHLAANQNRAKSFVQEVITNYQVDGLLYDDRLRFGGLDSDFSESTRKEFNQLVGKDLKYPDDIFTTTFNPDLSTGIKPGRYFDMWMAFRAKTMANFVSDMRQTVKSIRPQAMFGIYAGSWYGDYPKYGSNYASPNLQAGFPFLTTAYRQAGFADKLDILITGAYYSTGTVMQAIQNGTSPGTTVEAAGILSNRVAQDQSWAVAGIMLATFANNPENLKPALQAAAATTQGVMVFDLSHDFPTFRPILKQAFSRPAIAPYKDPTLIQSIRNIRKDRESRGFKTPPFPMFEGAPGTGF